MIVRVFGFLKLVFIILVPIIRVIHCKAIDTADASNIPEFELILAQLVCRHGDRNNMKPYPNDQYADPSFWPRGLQQLTNIGMQQHFELGVYLQQRYSELSLISDYSADFVYAVSSDTDRTIASADANLAGLFPPKDAEIWNGNLDWQPIPVHVLSKADDNLLQNTKACKRFTYEQAIYLTDGDRYEQFIENYKPLLEFIKEDSGYDKMTLNDVFEYQQDLFVEQLKGFDLPDWVPSLLETNGDLEQFVVQQYIFDTGTPELKKLHCGYLLKEMFDRISDKLASTLSPDRSLCLYFGHETTIATLLNCLGLFEPEHIPPYASCLMFELYKNANDDAYVQLFYKNASEPTLLEFPNCGDKCTISTLNDIYAEIIPSEDYDDECTLSDDEVMPPGGNPMNNEIQFN